MWVKCFNIKDFCMKDLANHFKQWVIYLNMAYYEPAIYIEQLGYIL